MIDEKFYYSDTAIRKGIDNTPSPAIVTNLELIRDNVYIPLTDKFGPLKITSGYRCPQLNKAVGGSSTSQHMEGKALDLIPKNFTMAEVFKYIQDNMEFDQLIWEFDSWIHVSYNTVNRKQVLLAKKIDAKTKYLPFKL